MSELTATHYIISMQRGETQGSKSPMWRCMTLDNERVNVFKHEDPNKNNYDLFSRAGYGEIENLVLGEELTWKRHPVGIVMEKSGKWWEIKAVLPRQANAQPDPQFVPNHTLYKARAIEWAKTVLELGLDLPNVSVWDTETTGVDRQAEIISIAVADMKGTVWLDTLIKPVHMDNLATDVHGITAADLANAPTFPEVYDSIKTVLTHGVWIGYNPSFDVQKLEWNCVQHGLEPILPLAVNDAMQYFAEFAGEWNPAFQKFIPKKLSEAAAQMGIEVSNAHNALADTLTTLDLIRAMARAELVSQPDQDVPFQ